MIKVQGSPAFTAVCVLALAGVLSTAAQGQPASGGATSAKAVQRGSGGTVAVDPASSVNAEDMRLWSFGDCARVFPFTSSDQYKQCVSVVSSDEGKEARAYRFCQTTFEKDPPEAARCKSTYKENQIKAAQEGRLSNASSSKAPLPPEVLQRVRTIASAGAERDRAAQEDGTAGTTPPAGTQVAAAANELLPVRASATNAANLAAANVGAPNVTPPSVAAPSTPQDRDSFGAFLVERMWTIIFLLMTFILLAVRHFNSKRKEAA